MALAPCLLGYGAAAKMLHDHENTVRENNTYWAWIKNYNEEDYTDAVKLGSGKFMFASIRSFSPLTIIKLYSKSTSSSNRLLELKSWCRSLFTHSR
jgi:hydroxymethylpyrimidine/phosphomethylpyrimidine kinase